MDKKIIVANWKSNKTASEALQFLKEFKEGLGAVEFSSIEIIILPQFLSIPYCFKFIQENNLPISLGVQTVSSFVDGPYTGEVSARFVKEFCSYVLLNHSERKKYAKETDEDLKNKFARAVEIGLTPLVCVQDEGSFFPESAKYVVFEPPSAISTFGTGKAQTREEVESAIATIKGKSDAKVLYGGSVSPEDIGEYLKIENLSGFLVGAASLESSSFLALLKKC